MLVLYTLKLIIVIRVSREHFKSRKKMKGKKRVQRKIKGGGGFTPKYKKNTPPQKKNKIK